MKRAILLVLIISLNRINCKFLKCCNKNEILFPEVNTTHFFCNSSNGISIIPLLLDDLAAENDICVDKTINNTIIKLNEKEFVSFVELNHVYKCCPKGTIYDILDKNCKAHYKKEIPFIVKKPTNFYPNFNFCQENGVVVDILTNSTQIDINFNSIIVRNMLTDQDEEISVDKSCFDFTKEGIVVIRSCKNRNICSEIPCVRKCCSFGTSYNNVKCVPNIREYNVDSFLPENERNEKWNGK